LVCGKLLKEKLKSLVPNSVSTKFGKLTQKLPCCDIHKPLSLVLFVILFENKGAQGDLVQVIKILADI